MSEFQGLSDQARSLLQVGHNHRFTDDEVVQLVLHLKMIASWPDRLPQETDFFFVEWAPIVILPRVEGLNRDQTGIAAYLLPLHSQFGAMALQVLWKANQLIRSLCAALNSGDLIVAATMARSLMETAAAFGCESSDLTTLWRARCRLPAPDANSLAAFVQESLGVIGQNMFGTKLKTDAAPATGIERTNIVTLVDKAEKRSDNPGIRRLYDLLCDTVHPSIGSNRCFWTQEPDAMSGPTRKFVTKRMAQGHLSDLPHTIGSSALWSLTWLGWMWNKFDRTRRDLCLTARLYKLKSNHFAITLPGKPGDFCPCGSTKDVELCSHEFGRSD